MPETVQGLTTDEARRRLQEDGPNALPSGGGRFWLLVRETAGEPMFLLLAAAAAVYLLLGDLEESLLLVAMVALVLAITLYQEGKTERALEALRDLSSPRALVIRDGQAVRIAGRDVVRGDLLLLAEGDRVAADGELLKGESLQVDESLLTGEAWPVSKETTAGGFAQVSAGTLVVQGSGLVRVTATGSRSEMGKIGAALKSLSPAGSRLRQQSGPVVRAFASAGVLLSLAMVILLGVLRGDWLQALLAGIALAMSLLPEEFAVILTVFPAIGAWRLAGAQVLTRRLSAIETLGAITVLCSDKTGTLTENRMVVAVLFAQGRECDAVRGVGGLPQAHVELAATASLASKPRAVDPMEQAFHQLHARLCPSMPAVEPAREYAFTSTLPAMSVARPRPDGGHDIATKGAPEAVARLCRMEAGQREQMLAQMESFAARGLRVLAVARARHSGDLPQNQHDFTLEYLGLIALADPLREEIPDAVQQCAQAGIRVIMITGDYPGTALAIARQAGLQAQHALTGAQLASLSDQELDARLRQVSVCARITPEQKLRIVEALKRRGEVVAMTGDGVNDAPALKAADVGIAMGARGTDVAREAAGLVLLDDNFASIVRGIRLGRRFFANMQNAMCYVMATHVPIAGMALLPVLLGAPVLLMPMHIGFLELIISPACSLAFENEPSDTDTMAQAPRDVEAPLFAHRLLLVSLLHGLGALAVVAMAYAWALPRLGEGAARAFGFTTLVMANVSLILATLSRKRAFWRALVSANHIPAMVTAAALSTLALTIYLPSLAGLFRFEPLPVQGFLLALAAGCVSLLWFEAVKWVAHRSLG